MDSRKALIAIAATSSAVAVASLSALAWMYGRIAEYERVNGVEVSLRRNAAQTEERKDGPGDRPRPDRIRQVNQPLKPAAAEFSPALAESDTMRVAGVSYNGDTELRVALSARPEMDGIRQYVSVEPLNAGFAGISYSADYDKVRKVYVPKLVVTGDFAHRTNVTLRIRKGLPLYGKGGDPSAKGALEETYTYTFWRKDLAPRVGFASPGRYLPPCGSRCIGVESVNRARVQAELRRVQPGNIVQLLAREEGEYRQYWGGGGDSRDAVELAGEATHVSADCENAPNKKEVWKLPVAVGDGGPSNGVYLVAVADGERPFRRTSPAFRLVCVSDLGVSVRDLAGGEDEKRLGVWVTSLMRGTPVGGASVEVYSSSNVKIMEAVTGEDGWCVPKRVAGGDPFAVVVRSEGGEDMTFMAISGRMEVDETSSDGSRRSYLEKGECEAFVWTERGIYRHGEKMFMHAIFRDGEMSAPKPFPAVLELISPDGNVFAKKTEFADQFGVIAYDGFSVPEDQPSGRWTLRASVPGKDGRVLGETEVKVEEFAPPQIRVAVAPDSSVHPSAFSFEVSAEHLFGGPASSLVCEGTVVFEDAPFAPAEWKDYAFGDDDRGLKPSFLRIGEQELDESGKTVFAAPMKADAGRPKAMVRATGQGVVFEDGGRPATARKTALLHYYPYYIGAALDGCLRIPHDGSPKVRIACVAPNGARLQQSKDLQVKIERIDSVYSYRRTPNGWSSWNCERVRSTVAEGVRVRTSADGDTEIALPLSECGDYALTVSDPASGASFSRSFYLCGSDDEEVRAPLSDPTEVAITPDKPFYRVGESPRLVVRSPFAGHALMGAFRDKEVYTKVFELTNATSEVVLPPVSRSDAPNLDVYFSVVQSVEANARHLAVRAHGQTTISVRPVECEIPVSVEANVSLSTVEVEFAAPGAERAVVTLVDEGINLLTGEPTPDPTGYFGEARCAWHPLYDLYGRILPVIDDGPGRGGVKTGGGFGAEMLGRVSPVASRRFVPIAMWKADVPVSDGHGRAVFTLPEFAGEVRVTAVAYGASATGSASVRRKVSPKLVAQPDAPRFVAPGDVFEATMPLRNTGSEEGEVRYSVEPRGAGRGLCAAEGTVVLAPGGHTNVVVRLTAPNAVGQLSLVFTADGLGESHCRTIELPVRPAVPWVETCGVCPEEEWREPAEGKWSAKAFDSPAGEYEAALRWLADYPHGCLEQTSSRIFPLVAAGGVFNAVVSNGTAYAAAGVRRVESMLRENDFVMWPDCNYAPWTREVSVYAAHFLLVAEKSGVSLTPALRARLVRLLRRWALGKDEEVSAYAVLALAVAGAPERDRMFRLYDARGRLSALARARLSLAFAEVSDRARAESLLADSFEPQSVKEAAFAVLALLECRPSDERILPLVSWLNARRDRAKFSWGTTEENAHALLAIGAYLRAHPPKKGARFISWRKLTLPSVADVRDEAEGIFVTRRYLRADGSPADMSRLRCGELLFAEVSMTTAVSRVVNDLVVEDLLPACFEPVHRDMQPPAAAGKAAADTSWVMRKDARDDRVLVFSKRFQMEKGNETRVSYPVRVVSAGDFVLPGTSVEGMYNPRLHARRAPGRVVVRH